MIVNKTKCTWKLILLIEYERWEREIATATSDRCILIDSYIIYIGARDKENVCDHTVFVVTGKRTSLGCFFL